MYLISWCTVSDGSAISAVHAQAPTAEATDWHLIARLYQKLATLAPSAIVEVNRAVAEAMAWGAEAGLQQLLRLDIQLDGYYPYHTAHAYLLRRTNQREAAADAYALALALCGNKAERVYLQRQLDELFHLAS